MARRRSYAEADPSRIRVLGCGLVAGPKLCIPVSALAIVLSGLATAAAEGLDASAGIGIGIGIALLVSAACSDPGVLPRFDLRDELPEQEQPLAPEHEATLPAVHGTFQLCPLTGIFLPPGATYCKVCHHVVAGFDHHSPLLGCCVGARNRRCFVLGAALLAASLIATSYQALLARDRPLWVLGLGSLANGAALLCLAVFELDSIAGGETGAVRLRRYLHGRATLQSWRVASAPLAPPPRLDSLVSRAQLGWGGSSNLAVAPSRVPDGGRGLFVTHAVEAGDLICEYVGQRYSRETWQRRDLPHKVGVQGWEDLDTYQYLLTFADANADEYWVMPLASVEANGNGSAGGSGTDDVPPLGTIMSRDEVIARWGAPPAIGDFDECFIDGNEPPTAHATEAVDARPARFANDRAAWAAAYNAVAAETNNAEIATLLAVDVAGGAAYGGSSARARAPPRYRGAALRATRALAAGDEVFLSYGAAYWGSKIDAQLQRTLPFIDVSGLGANHGNWRPPPPSPPRRMALLARFLCAATPPRLVDYEGPIPTRPTCYRERLRRALEPVQRLLLGGRSEGADGDVDVDGCAADS